MDNTLINLLNRVKGAKLYISSLRSRVYIPYSLDYPHKVRIKVFFEVVNDKLKLFVEVLSDVYCENWCHREAQRLKTVIAEQFHEIIYDCELKRNNIPLHIRLKDCVMPMLCGASETQKNAIRFLCRMKTSALVSESQSQRWFVAIRLAQSRHAAGRISRLHVFLPHACIAAFKEQLSGLWQNIPFPVLLISIESLSHNAALYLDTMEHTDPQTMLVIDSCHFFKSPKSIRSERMAVIAGKCNYKLIMTDSLIVNNIHDVYMQYNILSELILNYYRWEDFSRMHIIYGGFGGSQILGYKNIAYLANLVESYTYGMETGKAMKPLVQVDTYICELTEKQKYYYRQKKNELLRLIEKNELQLYDVFRIFIQMQKIVCGCLPDRSGREEFDNTNKLLLLKKCTGKSQYVIFCKFLFEIDLLTSSLGKANCAVISSRNTKSRVEEKIRFEHKEKKYLISTLSLPEAKLSNIKHRFDIIFFSLSFRYNDYRRCLTYIKNNNLVNSVSVKRFTTNSGIDRIIIKNLERKGKLAHEIYQILLHKSQLINL